MIDVRNNATEAMISDDPKTPKRRLNAAQKRALRSATLRTFVDQYGRKAQRSTEPNDRRYKRDVERAVKRMKPTDLDRLLRDDED